MTEKKGLSEQDLKTLHALRNKCNDQISKAKLEIENANLVYQNIVLNLRLKYGILDKEELNLETGEIRTKENV